jgi:hypothetical protein
MDRGEVAGPTRYRFSKIPSPWRSSSRKLESRAAAKRFLAMLGQRSGVEIDATVESVLLVEESHHGLRGMG